MLKTMKVMKCPKCGNKLRLDVPQSKEAVKIICPYCKHKYSIIFKSGAKQNGNKVNGIPANYKDLINKVKKPAQSDKSQEIPGTILAGQGGVIGTVVPRTTSATLTVRKQRYDLVGAGAWTIGRPSKERPSNIEIPGDDTISRCCATIIGKPLNGGISYSLSVNTSKNPIYINGIALNNGEDRELKSGDTIRMGNTKMTFTENTINKQF